MSILASFLSIFYHISAWLPLLILLAVLYYKLRYDSTDVDYQRWRDQAHSISEIILNYFFSFTVVLSSLIYKLPQGYLIWSHKSTEAISLPSILLEWTSYSIMATYQFAMGYPVHTYIENCLETIEDFFLTLMILYYRNELDITDVPYFAFYFISVGIVASNLLHRHFMFLIINSTTPMLIWSKFDQLIEILVEGSAGDVSLITWLTCVYCTAARIYTTITITKDKSMLLNLVTSQVFNVAIVVAILYYGGLRL